LSPGDLKDHSCQCVWAKLTESDIADYWPGIQPFKSFSLISVKHCIVSV